MEKKLMNKLLGLMFLILIAIAGTFINSLIFRSTPNKEGLFPSAQTIQIIETNSFRSSIFSLLGITCFLYTKDKG